MPEVKKLKNQFVIVEEKDNKETTKAPDYNEKVIIDITVKGKDSLDRISLLSQGKIKDEEERVEVLNDLAELINDLKIIQKQYK